MTEEEQAALYAMVGVGTRTSEEEENDKWQADLHVEFNVPHDYKLPPRECCGAPDDTSYDTVVSCAHGNCDVLYCRCGRSTEAGWGPIDCPCQLEAPAHWRVFERKMISVRRVALSTQKKRARLGRG